MRDTPLQRAADALLRDKQDISLVEWLAAREGQPVRIVARELWIATDEAIDVSHETIRAWTNDLTEQVA